MRLLLATLAAAGLATMATAQTSAPTPAAPPAAPAAAAPLDPLDQMVCRRVKETGSLVKSKKTCHTRRQWAYIDDVSQGFARDMQDSTRERPGGQ